MATEKINDCIFYHIYPLGFCGAPQKNDFSAATVNRIQEVSRWIPHMKRLGVNALYLGPVFQSTAHGYDTADYRLIDSRLGTNDEFKSVCGELCQAGIKLILDGVFNHVGRDFFAFKDVLQYREGSKYRDWFSGLRFDQNNSYGDGLHYDSWEGFECLVKLNLYNPEVRGYLLDSVDMWIDEFGIEGLRLDAADCVDRGFFKELHSRTRAKNPDFWLMGEIIHGNYRDWVNPEMLDSVTNYECYKGIHSSINSKNMFEIASSLNRQNGPWGLYKDIALYNFVDNHDVNRISNVLSDCRNLKNAYTLLFCMPGVPSIYYGSEWGIHGEKTQQSDAPLRPSIDAHNPPEDDEYGLMEHISGLSRMRNDSDALKRGGYEQVFVAGEELIFARSYESDRRLVFINISDSQRVMRADFFGHHWERIVEPFSSEIVIA